MSLPVLKRIYGNEYFSQDEALTQFDCAPHRCYPCCPKRRKGAMNRLYSTRRSGPIQNGERRQFINNMWNGASLSPPGRLQHHRRLCPIQMTNLGSYFDTGHTPVGNEPFHAGSGRMSTTQNSELDGAGREWPKYSPDSVVDHGGEYFSHEFDHLQPLLPSAFSENQDTVVPSLDTEFEATNQHFDIINLDNGLYESDYHRFQADGQSPDPYELSSIEPVSQPPHQAPTRQPELCHIYGPGTFSPIQSHTIPQTYANDTHKQCSNSDWSLLEGESWNDGYRNKSNSPLDRFGLGNSPTGDQYFGSGVVYVQNGGQEAIPIPGYQMDSVPLSSPQVSVEETICDSLRVSSWDLGILADASTYQAPQILSGTLPISSQTPNKSKNVPSSQPYKSTDDATWNSGSTAKQEPIPLPTKVKKRAGKGRQGVLPADKAKKAKEMRDVGACLPCWLLKVPCSPGKVCDKCRNSKSFSIGSPICTRKHLEDYTKLFFPEVSTAKFDIHAAKGLANELSQGFTANKLEIGLTCGRGYPGLQLTLTEFVPIYEKLSPVPFLRVGDAPAYFVATNPAPIALPDLDVDQILDLCRRHVANMVKHDSDVSVSTFPTDSLAEQIQGAIDDYYKTLTVFPNGDDTNLALFHKAKMLQDACYFNSRTITYHGDSATAVLDACRSPSMRRWDHRTISHLLNRQLKSTMNILIRDLTRDVLDELEKELKRRSRSTWAVSFCVILICCFYMELVQMSVTGSVMHKKVNAPEDYIPSTTAVVETCKELDDVPYQHICRLFHGVYRSQKRTSDKKPKHVYNPIRDDCMLEDSPPDPGTAQLIQRFREIVQNHGPELRHNAQPPTFDSGLEDAEQYMKFRDKNSLRLVSKFLLSFQEVGTRR